MKEYKLKQWYPSLANSWRVEDRYEYNTNKEIMTNISNVRNGIAIPKQIIIKKAELHPDFWELIEEENPLFVTEDGVYIYKDEWEMFAVEKRTFRKISILSSNLMRHLYLLFNEESNADEYIWRNKKVFSYEDFIRWGNVPYERVIEQLAKERSNNEF